MNDQKFGDPYWYGLFSLISLGRKILCIDTTKVIQLEAPRFPRMKTQ